MVNKIRNILTLLLFFIFAIQSVFAQSKLIDSLENALTKAVDDEKKLQLTLSLAKEYAPSSAEKCLKYANQAIQMASKEKNKAIESEAMVYIGDAYSFQNQYSEAISQYNKALEVAQKNKVYEVQTFALNSIGRNYYFQGDLAEAEKYYHQALSVSQKQNVLKEEGNAHFNLGQLNKKKGNLIAAEKYYSQAILIFKKTNDYNGLAKTNNSLGIISFEAGDYKKAVLYYQNALEYREKSGDKKGAAILYMNIGNVLLKWSKFEQAITNYQKALKVFDEIGMQEGIARCYNNIGLVYENLTRGDNFAQNEVYYNKALQEHKNALKIWESIGVSNEIANTYLNIGNVKAKKVDEKLHGKYGSSWDLKSRSLNKSFIEKEYVEVIADYNTALQYYEKVDNKSGIAVSLSNLGKISNFTGNYNNALRFLERALKIEKELNSRYDLAFAYSEIGRVYFNLNNNSKALEFLKESLEISEKDGFSDMTKTIYNELSKVYLVIGDYNSSLIAYKRHVELQDSLLNDNNMKQIAELQTQYETEKKEQQIQLLNKDANLKDAQIKQKNVTIYFFIAVILGVMVITVLLIKQNKERRKVNMALEENNKLITHQKKEITDSIHYAKRIQTAVMPSEAQIKTNLPDSFIYFRPRDIVSGDFYWAMEKKGKILIAAADCTGHGVPGAFMSMMGMSMINNIVAELEEISVDEILNELRSNIITSLHQTGREGENKDGMDMAFYMLDKNEMRLEFAGANNPLYIVRNGELLETKADRMPIGIHERSNVPFTKHNIKLEKGDMIYTFSDGYHDQFGGPNNKKFTSGAFKKLLARIFKESVQRQSEILHENITTWMNGLEQIDDILVIGVRV